MSYGSKDWQKWVLEEKEALPLLEHAYKVRINTWDTVRPSIPLYYTVVYRSLLISSSYIPSFMR